MQANYLDIYHDFYYYARYTALQAIHVLCSRRKEAIVKKHHILYIMITALTLGGCSSVSKGLVDAIFDPLDPKPHGYRNLSNIGTDRFSRGGLLPDVDGKQAQTLEFLNHSYGANDNIPIDHFFQNAFSKSGYTLKDAQGTILENGALAIYKQAYSAIVGAQRQNALENGQLISKDGFYIRLVQGNDVQNLPTNGEFRYQGKAITHGDERGRLDYRINYGTRQGSGTITGLSQFGNIALQQGGITGQNGRYEIGGAAQSDRQGAGNYRLGIFGPNAEEIAGKAGFNNLPNREVGFAGRRR